MCGVVARLMTFGSYMDNISVPCGLGEGGGGFVAYMLH